MRSAAASKRSAYQFGRALLHPASTLPTPDAAAPSLSLASAFVGGGRRPQAPTGGWVARPEVLRMACAEAPVTSTLRQFSQHVVVHFELLRSHSCIPGRAGPLPILSPSHRSSNEGFGIKLFRGKHRNPRIAPLCPPVRFPTGFGFGLPATFDVRRSPPGRPGFEMDCLALATLTTSFSLLGHARRPAMASACPACLWLPLTSPSNHSTLRRNVPRSPPHPSIVGKRP
jgi:hypothetical protein